MVIKGFFFWSSDDDGRCLRCEVGREKLEKSLRVGDERDHLRFGCCGFLLSVRCGACVAWVEEKGNNFGCRLICRDRERKR